jgi:hypothetical protein
MENYSGVYVAFVSIIRRRMMYRSFWYRFDENSSSFL